MPTLHRATVSDLPGHVGVASHITDPSALTIGIAHFGVGGFHRAHEAMFVDRLLAAGHTDWAICGIGVLPGDRRITDILAAQDHLYTLATTDADGRRDTRVIGAVADMIFAPDRPRDVLDVLTAPGTRIVSLTITEGGYGVDDTTGEFAPRDALTLRDLDHPDDPRSVFGFIVAALRMRRDAGLAPFTVMSCDNIEHNGRVARAAVTGFAARHDADLARWIDENVAFPSSMVDRITPATTDAVVAQVGRELGVDDAWPVASEAFAQWVLEDSFSAGRPPFDDVGVVLVDDVEPYEHMKLRLLNASHQVLSHLGVLAGYTYVHEALADADIRGFVGSYMRREALPTLRPVPGVDLDDYITQLLERFSNLAIRDTLARQMVNTSDRVPKFVLPVIADRLRAAASIDHAALMLAAWCAVLDADTIPMIDADTDHLRRLAWADHDRPGAFLENTEVFGRLASSVCLRVAYQLAKCHLQDHGPIGAMRMVAAHSSGVR
ncbi:mannitol dehydrogenase family protein [Williamsia herbipolensis]|uniref:mannitol dehydrogenase family protein n=1 Tax=Williamsia herbipolensis TaxID=1603258 RepID=UPI0005F78547|nr:mannitol dehydrogenase family protein [Williamsia herbipolensis]